MGSTGTIASDGSSAYAWDPSGSVLEGSGAPGGGTGGALALTDVHGNQVGQFTAAGTSLAASQSYDPWGNVTATSGSMTGLLGYQSAWTDAASGKDLMGARWYDPGTGDFTSADTVQVSPDPDEAAGNPFAYAADEPLDMVDPTGHYIVPPGGAYGAGTSERVGNGVTSPSNYIADVTTARVVQQAVISAPNDAAKAAAARAAVAEVEVEQAAAKKAAVAAAAAAQKRATEEAEAKARARAATEKSLDRAVTTQKSLLDPTDSSGGGGGAASTVLGWLRQDVDDANDAANWADQATGINSAVSCATHPSVNGCLQAASAVIAGTAAAFTDGTTELAEPALEASRMAPTTWSTTSRNPARTGDRASRQSRRCCSRAGQWSR